ncbi:HD domain-containing protein [Actinoplanes sichuanensis]|uniref:HD family hydrolase n=2 Tax=Actinoplanes sichuanensis TaxID=512349 RepID=A0ABW4A786_9ACTN
MISSHQTADAMISLGGLALDFGRVNRITYHQDGLTPESDTDHTVMLGLIACALADRYFPDLNVGLIAQYALVHDFVEVYAGDTPTLRMQSSDAKAEKAAREQAALVRIHREFRGTLPWVATLISSYETRLTPEARFVKALDKLLPKITHILNGAVTIRKQGMRPEELADRYEAQIGELQTYAADFPALFDLRWVLVDRVLCSLGEQDASVAPQVPSRMKTVEDAAPAGGVL